MATVCLLKVSPLPHGTAGRQVGAKRFRNQTTGGPTGLGDAILSRPSGTQQQSSGMQRDGKLVDEQKAFIERGNRNPMLKTANKWKDAGVATGTIHTR